MLYHFLLHNSHGVPLGRAEGQAGQVPYTAAGATGQEGGEGRRFRCYEKWRRPSSSHRLPLRWQGWCYLAVNVTGAQVQVKPGKSQLDLSGTWVSRNLKLPACIAQ